MQYETLELTIENGIAQVLLNRPDKKNALNTQMRAEILHAVKTSEQEARVLVLTGAGSAFCSGQDLSDRGGGARALLRAFFRQHAGGRSPSGYELDLLMDYWADRTHFTLRG